MISCRLSYRNAWKLLSTKLSEYFKYNGFLKRELHHRDGVRVIRLTVAKVIDAEGSESLRVCMSSP